MRSREVALDACDVVVVRGIPRGSLEQIVFRVDALHALAAVGVRAVNGALAIERTIDKFLASALLAAAGLPTPRTVACERADDALEAFDELGSDVIVKPLFGSMGFGMARVEDRDVAQRVFRALEIERAVYYLQETLPHDGVDVRAMVVGDRVVGVDRARGRRAGGRTSRAARSARAIALDDDRATLCVRAAAALGADYAGVDLLRAADGRDYVLEVNGIPGWHGRRGRDRRRRGGGARRAPGARREARAGCSASARSSSAAIAPLCSAVATSAPAAPASASAREVGGVAHAAAGEQLDVREAGVRARRTSVDVRSLAGADAREVEHDRLARAGVREARERLGRAPRRPARGRARAARRARRSRLSTSGASGSSARSAGTPRRRAASRCRSTTRAAPSSSSRATAVGVGGAGVDHHARLARQRRDDVGVPAAARRSRRGRRRRARRARTASRTARATSTGSAPVGDPAAQRAIAFALARAPRARRRRP